LFLAMELSRLADVDQCLANRGNAPAGVGSIKDWIGGNAHQSFFFRIITDGR